MGPENGIAIHTGFCQHPTNETLMETDVAKEVLGYVIYTPAKGGLWLADDEQTWTVHFHNAAEFYDADLASDIAERENPDGIVGTHYVLAVMGS